MGVNVNGPDHEVGLRAAEGDAGEGDQEADRGRRADGEAHLVDRPLDGVVDA